MAEGVTYAHLRFAQSPPQGKGRPPPAQHAHEEASDGELPCYENCPAAARPRPPSPPGPDGPPQAPGPARRRFWSRALLALLAACLFLLAACLGLGLRYWQVSRQLSWARAELSTARLALRQSWQAGNGTRQQLQEAREAWELARGLLQREKEKARRELEEARSCQQTGCCPSGWTLFRWKCLWVSGERKTWFESQEACRRHEARLLILKPWDAGTTWEATGIASSRQLWIGLRGIWNSRSEWIGHWVDGSPYESTEHPPGWPGACVRMSGRALAREDCSSVLQGSICEKAATPFPQSVDPSA